jgi:hypothetical protein
MALLPKVDRMIRRIVERLRHPRKRHTASLPVPTKPTTIATASPPLTTLIPTSTKKEKAEPDTRSRLKLLPAEIRLIIYEYALTNDTPLLCVKSPHHCTKKRHLLHAKFPCRSLNLSHYPSAEFNTLKHVSRLFYAETAGLELRYNTLLFRGSHSTSGLQRFFDFHTSCLSKKDQKKVRKVYIKHSKKIAHDSYSRRRVVRISLDTTTPQLYMLTTLLRRHTHLTVFYTILGLAAWLGPDLLEIGFGIHFAARGRDPEGVFNPWHAGSPVWYNNLSRVKGWFFEGGLAPENLRMMPQGKWREEAWVKGVKRLAGKGRLRVSGLGEVMRWFEEGGMEVWTGEVGRWYVEGF